MPKTVEDELSEANRMHKLAGEMKKQGDTSSASKLEAKVRAKRARAIARMGKRVNKAGSKKAVI